jgi:hypothetical protein
LKEGQEPPDTLAGAINILSIFMFFVFLVFVSHLSDIGAITTQTGTILMLAGIAALATNLLAICRPLEKRRNKRRWRKPKYPL